MLFTNGNNSRVGGNIARRIVPVRLDSTEAINWLRGTEGYKHPNLKAWIKENRGRIIAAILTIVRGWVAAGKPKPADLIILGSFESYSILLGSLLAFMGLKGFMSNLEELYNTLNIDTPVWGYFFEVWLSELGDKSITVADLVNQIKGNANLKAALPESMTDIEDKGFTRKMGKQLASREDYKFENGLTLRRDGDFRKAIKWKIVCFKNETHTKLASNESLESFSLPYAGEGNSKNNEKNNNNTKYIKGELNTQNTQLSLNSESLPGETHTNGNKKAYLLNTWKQLGCPGINLDSGATVYDLELYLEGNNAERLQRVEKILEGMTKGER